MKQADAAISNAASACFSDVRAFVDQFGLLH